MIFVGVSLGVSIDDREGVIFFGVSLGILTHPLEEVMVPIPTRRPLRVFYKSEDKL